MSDEQAFAALSRRACPPVGEALFAVAAAWREVSWAELDGWLDVVLASRRGHAVLLAAVATELGRRAGWQVSVCSSPTDWYAGVQDDGILWLVDPTGAASGERAPTTVRRHCAHEVAFVVLTGLAERVSGAGDEAQARRLRDRLDVFSP